MASATSARRTAWMEDDPALAGAVMVALMASPSGSAGIGGPIRLATSVVARGPPCA